MQDPIGPIELLAPNEEFADGDRRIRPEDAGDETLAIRRTDAYQVPTNRYLTVLERAARRVYARPR